MAKSTINPTVYNQLYRNQVNRGEQTREDDDYIKIPEITIYDVDYSILQYIRNNIKPEIQDRDRMIDVPVMYGSGELWSQVQSNGFMRDEKNKLLCPVITLSRTRMEEYKDFAKLDVNNRVSSRVYYSQGYTQNNARYGSNNRGSTDLPQKEIYITLIPEYYYVYYDLNIWTDFNEQLNKIVEMFIPVNNFVWGNDYQFVTNIEDFSFSTVNISKQERIVKASTRLRVLATLMPAFVERKSSIQKALSIKKVSVAERVINNQNIVESQPSRVRVSSRIALQANLNSFGTLSADINFVQKLQSTLASSASVTASALISKLPQASSLTSSNSLAASALVSKLASASLTGAGTTAADLTVVAFDSDAQAFFDRVTTAGGTLTTTEKNAVNTLVVQMKADGIWTKMKAIYPMVGASAAACAQNLKSASFTGTFSNGWTFANTGVKPNGTSAVMNTGYVKTIFLFGMSFYNRTNSNKLGYDIGEPSLGGGTHILLGLGSTSARARNNTNGNIDYNYGVTNVGFWQTNRIGLSTNGWNFNYNGVVVGQSASYDGILNNQELKLSGFGSLFSDRECAFASLNEGLTNTEASNFYTTVQAFQTSLSRQV